MGPSTFFPFLVLLLLAFSGVSSDNSILREMMEEIENDADHDSYTVEDEAPRSSGGNSRKDSEGFSGGRYNKLNKNKMGGGGNLGGGGGLGGKKNKFSSNNNNNNQQQNRGFSNKGKSGGGSSSREEALKKMEEELMSEKGRQQHAANAAEAEAEAARKEAVRKKREEKYQADLRKMNAEQRKVVKAQRRKDKKVVQKILKYYDSNDYYGVLKLVGAGGGFQGWYGWLRRGGKGITEKEIKKAYRNLAKTVHPDKNKDSRAEEAFAAIQEAYEVLGDVNSRRLYNEKRERLRKNQREDLVEKGGEAMEKATEKAGVFWRILETFLGPFFLPALVLSALIV